MAPTEGRLIQEKAHISKTPIRDVMSIFPIIYWKIIVEQTNEYSEWPMEQQFLKNGKRTLFGAKLAHDTTDQEIIHFYGMLIFMCLFLLPGANYTAYCDYAPMLLWTTTM
jgi:hypothetical protein